MYRPRSSRESQELCPASPGIFSYDRRDLGAVDSIDRNQRRVRRGTSAAAGFRLFFRVKLRGWLEPKLKSKLIFVLVLELLELEKFYTILTAETLLVEDVVIFCPLIGDWFWDFFISDV